jgi:hypothetical protein
VIEGGVNLQQGLDASQLHSFVLTFERDDLILDDLLVTRGVVLHRKRSTQPHYPPAAVSA